MVLPRCDSLIDCRSLIAPLVAHAKQAATATKTSSERIRNLTIEIT
jgi:hypothetical protein